MRTVALAPHPQLRPYVHSYRMVEDLAGEHTGRPIWTCPEPVGVLSVNFGRPTFHESGAAHPKVGLLGIQTRVRQWTPQTETYFVMAMLTVPGILLFFPRVGAASADRLLDVADFWGDREARRFAGQFPEHWAPDSVKAVMDNMLWPLAASASNRKKTQRFNMYQALVTQQRVDLACEQLGLSPRSMQRAFRQHLGISPKQILNLHRFQQSLKANAVGVTVDQDIGFSDQAHEIRTWRQYLDCTPRRYQAMGRSTIARHFASDLELCGEQPVFYL